MGKSSDDIRPTSKLLPDETFSKWNSVHCVLLHDGVSRKALVNKKAEVRFGKGSLISEGIFNWVPSSKNMQHLLIISHLLF